MSLLKQNTTKKEQVDKNVIELAKLDPNDNKSDEYKMKAIYNNAVYIKKSKSGYLSKLYYLVSWKDYLEEKNI